MTGFLRSVDPRPGTGLVILDGETAWTTAQQLVIPHPILLPELDALRDFATELQVEQGISQLYRETFAKPAELSGDDTAVSAFSGGGFARLLHVLGRARAARIPD